MMIRQRRNSLFRIQQKGALIMNCFTLARKFG